MTDDRAPAGPAWPLAKRILHWSLAAAVLVALLAPKPEDGGGLVHIAAGSAALSLALVRLFWRSAASIRPRLRDAFRLRLPNPARVGGRAFAMPASQLARLIGFLFLALLPATAALGFLGVGEDSPALEAHEAAGTAVIALSIAHAVFATTFYVLTRADGVRVLLTGMGAAGEGGARGLGGAVFGAVLAALAVGYAWGPYDITGRIATPEQGDHHGGETDDD